MVISDLTNSQKEAYKRFVNFLIDPNEKNLIIQGSAGTGKSYLTRFLIENGIKNYKSVCQTLDIPARYRNFAITATTNKAVESLASQLDKKYANSVVTINSLLGLRVDYDYKRKMSYLTPVKESHIICNTIIFIDECSMISKDLFGYICTLCKDCKIVYIGDKYQLPPVKEKISMIYEAGYPEITLTEPVRNAGNQALVDLCTQLKNTCETGKWHDIHSVAGSIEIIKEGSEMYKIFESMFSVPSNDKRVLGYTNQLVSDYAQCIMELRGESDYLQKDTWYTSNCFYKLRTTYTHSYNYEGEFFGSRADCMTLPVDAEIKILEVKDATLIDYDAFHFGKNANIEKLCDQKMLKKVKIYSPHLGLSWWATVFATPDYYFQYSKFIQKASPILYRAFKEEVLDLRRCESSTVHKAQGSTLDTVLIDLYDISTCKQKDLTAKLLYVAASRAKNKVIFYGDLNKRYGVKVA